MIEPLNDITSISGNKAFLRINYREESVTNYLLRDNDYESVKNESLLEIMEKWDRTANFETFYYISFSQPLSLDSIQIDVKLETNDSSLKFDAVLEVSKLNDSESVPRIRSLYSNSIWIKLCEGLVTESDSYNIEFGLQPISVLRIRGFRFKTDDKEFRIPLHISRVRVGVNHTSIEWLSGKRLILRKDINELFIAYHSLLNSHYYLFKKKRYDGVV
jgi:hypothetical protein